MASATQMRGGIATAAAAGRRELATAALMVAVAYNAVVTDDLKLGGVPVKTFLLGACLLAWLVTRRPWRSFAERPALTVPVLVVGLGVPAVWLAIAALRHAQGDPVQRAGLGSAVTESSHFLYLLLFFPLVDHLRRRADAGRSTERIWLWPVLVTCAITILIWLAWVVGGLNYGTHQFTLVSGTIGDGPSGYRVALVTQIMLIPALAVTLARVAERGLTRGSAATLTLLLGAAAAAQTRGYWLGLLIVAGLLIVLTNGWLARIRGLAPVVLVAVLLALATSQVLVAAGPSATSVNQISLSQRIVESKQLLQATDRHLLLGSGLGATIPDGYVRSTSDPWSFELTYFQLLFELGPFGLAIVLSLPLLVCWRSWRILRAAPGLRAQSAEIALASMLALLVADSTNPYLINSVGMLAVAVCAGSAELALTAGRSTDGQLEGKLR